MNFWRSQDFSVDAGQTMYSRPSKRTRNPTSDPAFTRHASICNFSGCEIRAASPLPQVSVGARAGRHFRCNLNAPSLASTPSNQRFSSPLSCTDSGSAPVTQQGWGVKLLRETIDRAINFGKQIIEKTEYIQRLHR